MKHSLFLILFSVLVSSTSYAGKECAKDSCKKAKNRAHEMYKDGKINKETKNRMIDDAKKRYDQQKKTGKRTGNW